MPLPPTIEYDGQVVRLLDQRQLPLRSILVEVTTVDEVADAIRTLMVRGAPAIGAAAAFGLVLAAKQAKPSTTAELLVTLNRARTLLAATRPTAVNLVWALDTLLAEITPEAPLEENLLRLEARAVLLLEEDVAANKQIGKYGAELFPGPVTILTHCNAGALATCGYGTALGVVRALAEAGKLAHVYADETRPVLQGARLTAWELLEERLPCTLLCDNMAAWVMATRGVDAVIVGADRIAANGDVANKIGTYQLALVAKAHGVPFYVAAPLTTFDLTLKSGAEIPIEERDPREVTDWGGIKTAPEGIGVFNPAFDVTPARLIAGLITEHGVILKPSHASIARLISDSKEETLPWVD